MIFKGRDMYGRLYNAALLAAWMKAAKSGRGKGKGKGRASFALLFTSLSINADTKDFYSVISLMQHLV
jgi:hypothetical protein